MEDCEVRLGLISVVVIEQREALGKLERTRIKLETKREALERMKEEMTLRGTRVERAKAFLEGLKVDGSILSGAVSAEDETMSLVQEELQRQEDLENKRLASETEKMERLAVDISSHEDEVNAGESLPLHKFFSFQVVQLEKVVEYIEVGRMQFFLYCVSFFS